MKSINSIHCHRILLGVLAGALGCLSGCFNPNGGVTGYFAYISTPTSPKTVVIYDVRSGDPWFVKEIPVGKQLNFRFLSDGGDNPQFDAAMKKNQETAFLMTIVPTVVNVNLRILHDCTCTT